MGEMGCLSLLDLPARFERLGEVCLREVGTPPLGTPPLRHGRHHEVDRPPRIERVAREILEERKKRIHF